MTKEIKPKTSKKSTDSKVVKKILQKDSAKSVKVEILTKPISISKEKIKPLKTKKIKLDKNSYATGKRKESIVKSYLKKISGAIKITVNNKDYKDYFKRLIYQKIVFSPFAFLEIKDGYEIIIIAQGGGLTGQAGAIKLAIAKLLANEDSDFRLKLRNSDFLTRDARKVERKKPGLRKARKKEQFAKR